MTLSTHFIMCITRIVPRIVCERVWVSKLFTITHWCKRSGRITTNLVSMIDTSFFVFIFPIPLGRRGLLLPPSVSYTDTDRASFTS